MHLLLLNFAHRYGLSILVAKVEKFIAEHADDCLADAGSSASLLPQAFLHHMFESGDSNVSEITLFRILAKLDNAKQRDLLGHIRLPLMRTADILKDVLPSGLVDKDVCIQALAYQADASSVALPEKATRTRCWLLRGFRLGQAILEFLRADGRELGVALAAVCQKFTAPGWRPCR